MAKYAEKFPKSNPNLPNALNISRIHKTYAEKALAKIPKSEARKLKNILEKTIVKPKNIRNGITGRIKILTNTEMGEKNEKL